MVTIIGAGFSGLALAWFLTRRGVPVRVLERAAGPGGLLGTSATPYGPVERAAMTVLNNPAFEALGDGAGVPLVAVDRRAARRFVFRDRPRQWPLSAGETVASGVRALGAARRHRLWPEPRETLSGWGERVLGPAPTRFLLEPVFQGIYAGDGQRLSASLLIGGLRDKPRGGPRPRQRGSVAPEGGMGALVEGLHRRLEAAGVAFTFGQEARLPATLDHPHVVCSGLASLPALLEPRGHPPLPTLETVPLVSLTLFFPPSERSVLPGFGCLFPRDSGMTSLGVLFMSHLFPARHPDAHVETWLLGGARAPDLLDQPDQALLAAVAQDRQRLLRHDGAPVGHCLSRWPAALPHYTVALEEMLRAGLPAEPNLFYFGNFLGTVGLGTLAGRAAALAAAVAA